ncbi:hypothetical protein D0Z00_002119 [Geotrichum galactomycetum]|uniref:Uncharacterized protein n=1 Tax=Geotrichum galactomycetum TaxID=27317 RepID=A0ACB6V518_9ASCO|nr:hypothetical protein D0Z00_002119 [Geotrichum candidum]
MNIETIDAAPLTFNLDHDRRSSFSDSDSDLGYGMSTGHHNHHQHNTYDDSDYHSKHSDSSRSHEISREELDLYIAFFQDRISHRIPPVGKRGLPPVNGGTVMLESEAYRANRYLLSFVERKLGFKPRSESSSSSTLSSATSNSSSSGSGGVHAINTNVSATTVAHTLHTRVSSNPLSKFYKKVFSQATGHAPGSGSSHGDSHHNISPSSSNRSNKLLISLSSSSSSTSSHNQGLPRQLVFKKSHPYLQNIGTLRLHKTGPRIPFTVLVDPRFPHSYIDMEAIVRESSNVRDFDLLARAFKIVATPRYSPEDPHNRVVIDVELIKAVIDDDNAGVGAPGSWAEASCETIMLMDVRPYNCILGKDWLNVLNRFTHNSTSQTPSVANSKE